MEIIMRSLWGFTRPKAEVVGFARSFPVLAWLIMRPQVTLLLAAFAAIVLRLYSPVLALSPFCIWTALVSLYLERRVIDRLLFPPFTAVTCWTALGTGVGIPIMDWQIGNALRMTIYGISNWHPAMLTIQLVYLISFPLAWIGYYYGGFRKVPLLTEHSLFDGTTALMQKKITAIGWVFFLTSVFILVIKVSMGLENKSRGLVNVNGFTAFQTLFHLLFAIAPKWGMLGFVFVPRLWNEGRTWKRIAILALLIVYFCTALVTGSRGWLLYPCCLMVIGGYFFRHSSTWKIEITLFALAVIGFLTVFAIYVYRQSDQYVSSSASDIPARYRAFRDSVIRLDSSKWKPETVFDFGYSFFGLEDVLVYGRTPATVAHVGFSGFGAIPLTWIPTTLVKNKPRLLDAEFIVSSYGTPPPQAVGMSISLTADAYRRFGWSGIPVVVLIFFGIYGMLVRWMLTWWQRGTLWGWTLLLFTMPFFWNRPFGTVLGTWWAFFYDMPKQLLATAILCLLVSKYIDFTCSRNRTLYDDRESV